MKFAKKINSIKLGPGQTTYPGAGIAVSTGSAWGTSIAAGTNGHVLTMVGGAPAWAASSGGGTSGWALTGNTGTNPATNFIGTTDDQPISFRINNIKKALITSTEFRFGDLSGDIGSSSTVIDQSKIKFVVAGSTVREMQVGLTGVGSLYGALYATDNGALANIRANILKTNRIEAYGAVAQYDKLTVVGGPYASGNPEAIVFQDAFNYNKSMIIYGIGTGPDNYATAPVSITPGVEGNTIIGGFATDDIPSAKLQVKSTNRGFLPPRMTTTQKNAITAPVAGLLVYDTTLLSPFFYNGTSWNGTGIVAGSNKEIQFNNSGALGADSNLKWDNINKRLGIGTLVNPAHTLDIQGDIRASGTSSVSYWIPNGSAFRGEAGASEIYFDGNTTLTGTINFRATNLFFAGYFTASTGRIGSTILGEYGDLTISSSLPSFRLNKSGNVWYVEQGRFGTNAFEISNNIGATPAFTIASNGSVALNNSTPAASAQLEVASTTRGFLPPRMTTTEKNAIATPAAGLLIYDTTLNKLCVYTTAWQTITST